MDSECSLVSDSTWICSRLYRIYDRKTRLVAEWPWFVGLFSIAMYWLATWLTFKGTSIISRITSQGFLLGTVLPGVVIIVMAIIWIAGGNGCFRTCPGYGYSSGQRKCRACTPRFFPHMTGSVISLFWRVFYCCLPESRYMPYMSGKERTSKTISCCHVFSCLDFFSLFTLGSLAVAIVTPYDQINLQAGLFVSFQQLFSHYHIGWLTNVMGLLAAFGALAGVMSWISRP